MIEATLKKKAGQAGNADAHPYLRADSLEIRVSPHEKGRIVQNSIDNGFDSVAQFVREQAIHAGRAANPLHDTHLFQARCGKVPVLTKLE